LKLLFNNHRWYILCICPSIQSHYESYGKQAGWLAGWLAGRQADKIVLNLDNLHNERTLNSLELRVKQLVIHECTTLF